MTGGATRRWLAVGAWLLTPVVAWAVAFLGGWGGAIVGGRIGSPLAGIGLMMVGALLGAVAGVYAWVRLLRHRLASPANSAAPHDDESSG